MVLKEQYLMISILVGLSALPAIALRLRRVLFERRQARSLELALQRALRQEAREEEGDESESGWVIAG